MNMQLTSAGQNGYLLLNFTQIIELGLSSFTEYSVCMCVCVYMYVHNMELSIIYTYMYYAHCMPVHIGKWLAAMGTCIIKGCPMMNSILDLARPFQLTLLPVTTELIL